MANDLLTRALICFENHKAVYYRRGEYYRADFWDYAEIFEIACDLYEAADDEYSRNRLKRQFEEMYRYVIDTYGYSWEMNPFNDDIMWLCIAFTRAYGFTGKKEFLTLAKKNFDLVWKRAFSEKLGGGLYWRIENKSKNTCVNCPGAIAAALIAKATGEEQYYLRSALCLDWAQRMMFEKDTGKVYDAINIDGKINKWSSTYNQGTFIGASLLLWEYTKEDSYREDAIKAADYLIDEMYHGGIMNNEENGNDLPGFKGILARYLRRLSDSTGEEKYRDWLRMNADSAYNNRNTLGLMGTQLAEKAGEGMDFDVFTMSAAVSVVVNAV